MRHETRAAGAGAREACGARGGGAACRAGRQWIDCRACRTSRGSSSRSSSRSPVARPVGFPPRPRPRARSSRPAAGCAWRSSWGIRSSPARTSGTAPALGRALADRAGVEFVPLEYATIAKIMDDAKTGAWDVAMLAIDPARRNVLDYSPPYVVVDITYLVAPGSTIRAVADADRPGVRIAVARGAATGLVLQRALKHATLVAAESESAAFDLLKRGGADAYVQNRFLLLGLADTVPGARVLDDRVTDVQIAVALPKGRAAALAYVSAFVEDAKAGGSVQQAIRGMRGVTVAPAAPRASAPAAGLRPIETGGGGGGMRAPIPGR
ncbi:MAG: transporter substrate-binding domain-containing protein [Candidatus Rokubacteria bacterium]|nr:transporter substrate-binding domain-containing protein [Candidatus Rokubacteria bacterium]